MAKKDEKEVKVVEAPEQEAEQAPITEDAFASHNDYDPA